MNKFVKVFAYNQYYTNWFLWITKEDFYNMSDTDLHVFQKNMLNQLLKPSKNGIESQLELASKAAKFQFALKNPVSEGWQSMFNKYPGSILLVRQNGSFMCFDPETDKILEEVERKDFMFPEDKPNDILICENDPEPEQWWVDNLNKRFSQKKITTLGNFGNRSQEEIDYYVANSEIISFTTTFTTVEWFNKLCIALGKTQNKTLYFHCKDENEWDNVLNEFVVQSFANHKLNIIYKNDLI